jgi:hypothetical protein
MNSTSGLDASCVAAATAAGQTAGAACTLPEKVSKHISTPVFVMNSRFDPALLSICTNSPTAADVNRVGQYVIDAINATVLETSPSNAASDLFHSFLHVLRS